LGPWGGIPPALGFVALRPWLARPPWLAGLWYGIALLLIFEVAFLAADIEFAANPVKRGLGRAMFAPLFLAYGVALAYAVDHLRQSEVAGRPGRRAALATGLLCLGTTVVAIFTDFAPLRPAPPIGLARAPRVLPFLLVAVLMLGAGRRLGTTGPVSRVWSGFALGFSALVATLGGLLLALNVLGLLTEVRKDPTRVPLVIAAIGLGIAVLALPSWRPGSRSRAA